MLKTEKFFLFSLIAMTCVLLSSCTTTPPSKNDWHNAEQIIVVMPVDWQSTTATLYRFDRKNGEWLSAAQSVPVNLGRTGSAWGSGLQDIRSSGPIKKEGDGKAPAGIFRIGDAFGYAPSVATKLKYTQMKETHYCMDVPDSAYYNQIVDSAVVGEEAVIGSTEPMRLDLHKQGDQSYQYGFVIEHNQRAQKNAGSCIFAHIWKGQGVPTAGCTAMSEAAMVDLLQWIDPAKKPVFVLMPETNYRQLRRRLSLPDISQH